ncbi:hypothetical protein AMTRI_Chr04g244540 [Amborella trichopoda]|nr:sec14 cytosolic factor isoform X1 [Amborella trichopoda]|eukprot:XP_006849796.2 sec14 cytosolic factor isoform X1 [Amborella trichopoda]
MEESHQIAVQRMRNSIKKLGSSVEKQKDATLMRFLVARSMDPEKAARMFVQWAKWRADFVPRGHIPDDEVLQELESKKIYLQGLSKNGYSLLIVLARKHFPSKDHLQFKKFVVHLLDKTIASSFSGEEKGDEKLVAILDLESLTLQNIDPRALITGFQFLQAYYPERLARLYLLNMPWIFVSVWKMVSRFLEKATLEKVVIVGNEEGKRTILEDIGEGTLPEEYGGRAKLTPLQDVKLSHWPLTA